MPPCLNEQYATHWKAEFTKLVQKIYPARWKDELFKAELRLIDHQRQLIRESRPQDYPNYPSPKIGRAKSKAKKKSKK